MKLFFVILSIINFKEIVIKKCFLSLVYIKASGAVPLNLKDAGCIVSIFTSVLSCPYVITTLLH